MSLHPDALDRIVEAELFAAVRWFRAVAEGAALALVCFMPWWIAADAITRAGR